MDYGITLVGYEYHWPHILKLDVVCSEMASGQWTLLSKIAHPSGGGFVSDLMASSKERGRVHSREWM